jgi:hypothetical protein
LYYENEDHYKAFKELYRECDWPDKFNPLLFDSKRHEGGKKYGSWESTPRPTEREKSYVALPHLYQLMAVARDRVQQQIHLVDATYRLENNTDIDIWARQGLESQILNAENYLLKPRWKEDNDGLRTELEYRRPTSRRCARARVAMPVVAGPGCPTRRSRVYMRRPRGKRASPPLRHYYRTKT